MRRRKAKRRKELDCVVYAYFTTGLGLRPEVHGKFTEISTKSPEFPRISHFSISPLTKEEEEKAKEEEEEEEEHEQDKESKMYFPN